MIAQRLLPAGADHSDAWYAARSAGLGGSEIAAVIGLSPYESRFSLWHRKAGLVGPQHENEEMRWGTKLEPIVAAEFADRHAGEFRVRRTGTWCHPTRTWQIANPDRLLHPVNWSPTPQRNTRRAIWEGKTANNTDGWGEPGTDEIPVYYRCQVLWYLDVLGLDVAYLSVLIAGSDYREYVIGYALDEAMFLRTTGRAFLDTVAAGERPDIDEHSATYQVVRDLHPDIDGEDIDVDPDIAVRYLNARDAMDIAEPTLQQAKSALLDAMGNARRALFDGKPIARRQPGRGGAVSLHPIKPKAQPGQKVSTAA